MEQNCTFLDVANAIFDLDLDELEFCLTNNPDADQGYSSFESAYLWLTCEVWPGTAYPFFQMIHWYSSLSDENSYEIAGAIDQLYQYRPRRTDIYFRDNFDQARHWIGENVWLPNDPDWLPDPESTLHGE